MNKGAKNHGWIGSPRARKAKNRRPLLLSLIAHGIAAALLGAAVIWTYEDDNETHSAELEVSKEVPRVTKRRGSPPPPQRTEVKPPSMMNPMQLTTAANINSAAADGFYIPAAGESDGTVEKALKEAASATLAAPTEARPVQIDFSGQIDTGAWSADTAPVAASMASAPPGLSSMVSAPRSSSNARAEEFEAFKGSVREAVQRAQEYPHFARARDIEGRLALSILLKRDGQVADVSIEASSGSDVLDAAAVKSVLRAGRLTAFPDSVQAASMRLSVPVRFELEGI